MVSDRCLQPVKDQPLARTDGANVKERVLEFLVLRLQHSVKFFRRGEFALDDELSSATLLDVENRPFVVEFWLSQKIAEPAKQNQVGQFVDIEQRQAWCKCQLLKVGQSGKWDADQSFRRS